MRAHKAQTHHQIGHIMHAYIINSRGLRKRSSWPSSRFKLKIDPQNSSITTFRFCPEDPEYPNAQTSSDFVLTSRLPQEGRPLVERVAPDPLPNTVHSYPGTGDQFSPGIDEYALGKLSPMPRNPIGQRSFFSNSAPAHWGKSVSSTQPSLVRSPDEEDVFTESKPLDHTKRSYRGELTNTARLQRPDLRSLPTLPTLSSDSSGSSISTLATPASPSPAPRHVRRAQGRLSLPTPTPTPAAAEPSRRAHARMSLMFPLPTPGASATESRAAYRNSLDLSELARCRLWDTKGNERDNVRVLDKEYMQSLPRQRL